MLIFDGLPFLAVGFWYGEKMNPKLKPQKMASLHDFDLSFFLKLMHETGRMKAIKIIALPAKMEEEDAERELRGIL